jgi:ketosteroid isomerase-like protein
VSQENVEIAARVVAALNRRDADGLIELADPDVEWRSFFAELGDEGVYRGHDGTRRYMRDLHDAWEMVQVEVDGLLGVGGVVVGVGRVHYRGRGSGVESESQAGWMFGFRGTQLVQFRAFREPEQALKAVGLEE